MESKLAIYHKALLGALGALTLLVCITLAALAYVLVRYLPEQQGMFEARLASVALMSSDASAASTTQTIASLSELSERLQKNRAMLASTRTAEAPRSLTSIIEQWSPLVPRLSCDFATADNLNQTGSGMLVARGHSMEIWTNKHVISTMGDSITASICVASFLNGNTFYVSGDDFSVDTSTDFGYVTLKSHDVAILEATPAVAAANLCHTPVSIGDQVVVLGYPSIGASSGITATEGIISGIEGEHGSSGGIAIDVARNCYLGIPTFVESGQLESLARVLRWQSYEQFVQ
jgi:hypothetical protein